MAPELILPHYDFSCFEVWRRIVDAIRELTDLSKVGGLLVIARTMV